MEKLAGLKVLLPVLEESHGCPGIDDGGVEVFLDLRIQIYSCQVLELLRLASCLPHVLALCILVVVGVDAVDVH